MLSMMNAVRMAEYNAPCAPSVLTVEGTRATYEDEKSVQTITTFPDKLLILEFGALVVDFPNRLLATITHHRGPQLLCPDNIIDYSSKSVHTKSKSGRSRQR